MILPFIVANACGLSNMTTIFWMLVFMEAALRQQVEIFPAPLRNFLAKLFPQLAARISSLSERLLSTENIENENDLYQAPFHLAQALQKLLDTVNANDDVLGPELRAMDTKIETHLTEIRTASLPFRAGLLVPDILDECEHDSTNGVATESATDERQPLLGRADSEAQVTFYSYRTSISSETHHHITAACLAQGVLDSETLLKIKPEEERKQEEDTLDSSFA
jgi:hypothetical protein